jgi:hypothetical protein
MLCSFGVRYTSTYAVYQTTHHHIPEYHNLNTDRCENLKSHKQFLDHLSSYKFFNHFSAYYILNIFLK